MQVVLWVVSMLDGMRVWDCGDLLDVGGMQVSCEVGCVFPIGEYEEGQARVGVPMGVGVVDGLF